GGRVGGVTGVGGDPVVGARGQDRVRRRRGVAGLAEVGDRDGRGAVDGADQAAGGVVGPEQAEGDGARGRRRRGHGDARGRGQHRGVGGGSPRGGRRRRHRGQAGRRRVDDKGLGRVGAGGGPGGRVVAVT